MPESAWLRAAAAFQDELEVAYSNVVSVSIDPPDVSAAFRAGLGARFVRIAFNRRPEVLDEAERRLQGAVPP